VGYFKVYGATYRLCTMSPKSYVSDLEAMYAYSKTMYVTLGLYKHT
jgi:hypothetical protein